MIASGDDGTESAMRSIIFVSGFCYKNIRFIQELDTNFNTFHTIKRYVVEFRVYLFYFPNH